MGSCGLDEFGFGCEPVAGPCENSIELSGSINGREIRD
jgi:hypothetical protein